jgi:hypothetical protein
LEDALFLFISIGKLVLVKQIKYVPKDANALNTRIGKDRPVFCEHLLKELTQKPGELRVITGFEAMIDFVH